MDLCGFEERHGAILIVDIGSIEIRGPLGKPIVFMLRTFFASLQRMSHLR